MSEAQRRAEARRAKILARGGAGLAKLASTARGEEAAALYDTHIPSRGSTPVAPPVQNPVTADPAAEYQAELERTMAALGSSTQGTDNTGDAMKQFGEMMRKMQQDFGTSTPGSGGAIEGGLGAVDPSQDPPTPPLPAVELPDVPARRGNNNPFALAAASGPSSAPEGDMSSLFPGLNIPPEMLQMLQGGGNDGGGIGMNGPTSGNPFAPPPPAQKSPVTRLLPLIHLLSVVAFYLFTILVWEPSVWASGRQSGLGKMDSASVPVERRERWTRLRGDVGSKSDLLESGWASLPVFWAFVTLEVLLLSTQSMILPAAPPSLPSLLSNFLPLIPPVYSRPLLSMFRYFALASQVATDAALLLFLFGLGVVFAR